MIKTKVYEHREFEMETVDGFVRAYLPCLCNAEWKVHYEPNYGADADGNRGEGRWIIDDVTISNIEVDDDYVKHPGEELINKIIKILDEPKEYPK